MTADYDLDMAKARGDELPPALHELEAKVMEELWSLGEAPVRDVLDGLNAHGDRPLAYTTVMTILQRLDRKGVVTRRRHGKMHIYAPVWTREEYSEARAGEEVAALIERYGEAALVHFTREVQRLDPTRRQQLRRLARRA